MSTFLQLVNVARSEAGVAGGDLVTLQSGLSTESTRFKAWVANEWSLIQSEHPDWQFLRVSREFDTTASQGTYTPQQAKATDDGTTSGTAILADWKRDSFRLSTAGSSYADEAQLSYMPWDLFRDIYLLGSSRSQTSKPVVFSIDPARSLRLGDAPDAAYTVGYEFYRTPQALSADADEPLLPARFHLLLAYRALRAYGIFTAAPEVIGRADEKIASIYPDLVNDQLPAMEAGPPLA